MLSETTTKQDSPVMDGSARSVFETGVRATMAARLAGARFAQLMRHGGLAAMDTADAVATSRAAALNPYAAFSELGVDLSSFDLSREGTQQFLMRRWVGVNEELDYAKYEAGKKAEAYAKEEAAVVRAARGMGVPVSEAQAALVLSDQSFFRKAEENMVYK